MPQLPVDGEVNAGRRVRTLESLRAALLRCLDGAVDDEDGCDALETLAREAQDRQLHGEHMRLALKKVWNDLPEVERIRDPAVRKTLLDHLVKLCIDAYTSVGRLRLTVQGTRHRGRGRRRTEQIA